MNTLPPGSDAALMPVREALAADARARVADIERAARLEASATIDAADRERDRLRTEAEAAGEAEATVAAALASARRRRLADERLLAQREAIRAELARRVRAAATAATGDPLYPDVLEQLRARAVRVLGPAAVVRVHDEGGVTATAGSRTVDLTLPTLAARQLDSLSAELAPLWTP
jgi:hypothetical protein